VPFFVATPFNKICSLKVATQKKYFLPYIPVLLLQEKPKIRTSGVFLGKSAC